MEAKATSFQIRDFAADDYSAFFRLDKEMTLETMGPSASTYNEQWIRSITAPDRTTSLQWRTLVVDIVVPHQTGNNSNDKEVPQKKRTAETAGLDATDPAAKRQKVDQDAKASANAISDQAIDKAAAFLMYCFHKDGRKEARRAKLYYVELFFLSVDKPFRSQGIASALIKEMVKRVREQKTYRVREIRLHVVTTNEKALALYGKHGFAKTVLKKQYPQDGTDAWRMVLNL